ncbi:MAG: VOC family protein [Thermomicrobiales bacterium]
MASVATYLNFSRETEQAFTFYKTVFGTEFLGQVMRYGDMPSPDGTPAPEDNPDRDLIMHITLPITGGHMLMGTDAPESMGHSITKGNNAYIMLMPDSKEEADRLFGALSDGGTVEMGMSDQFWGDYFGSLIDKFGVQWMIDVPSEQPAG